MSTKGLGAPTMTLADIAVMLEGLYGAVEQAQFAGATLADGIAWQRLKSTLTSTSNGLLVLAYQVAQTADQVAATNSWVADAQQSIASLQSQVTACQAQAKGEVGAATAGWIAVGSALAGGILGVLGGSYAAKGKWWPWTS